MAGGQKRIMMSSVYILYSESRKRYYVGSTNNFIDRLTRHNQGRSKYTKSGIPWKTLKVIELNSRSEAMSLEKRIKKRGIKRYLEDIKFGA